LKSSYGRRKKWSRSAGLPAGVSRTIVNNLLTVIRGYAELAIPAKPGQRTVYADQQN